MKRFWQKQSFLPVKQLAVLIFFVLILIWFFFGVSYLSKETKRDQCELLKTAISRSITHCYATEGHYPEDLAYLREHYGITYDTEQFFIDYQILGKNIFPDVTVIEIQEDRYE